MSASWYDPSHDGEGFLLELLENNRAVMYWFTYDDDGNQDWYVASGKVSGNRIEFLKLKRVSGGVFGPDFDPGNITREVVGSASFIWSGCDTGSMSYRIGTRHGRMQLHASPACWASSAGSTHDTLARSSAAERLLV